MKNKVFEYMALLYNFLILYKKIIQFIFIFLCFIYIIYGYAAITINRVFFFFFVIIIILIYKYIYNYIVNIDYKYSHIKIILIFVWDFIKALPIYYIVNIELILFNYIENHFIINFFKIILIEPLSFILYKFYKMLSLWLHYTLYQLFFSRLFGLMCSILIFTPIYTYMGNFLNWSFLNLYLFLIFICGINIIISYNSKYLQFFVKYLNIDTNIWRIIEIRNAVSIISKLLIQQLKKHNYSNLNVFVFQLNILYGNEIFNNNIKCYISFCKIVKIGYINFLYKINQNNKFYLFNHFITYIEALLNLYLLNLSYLIHYNELNNLNFSMFKNLVNFDINNLRHILIYLIKLILSYLWSIRFICSEHYLNFEDFNKFLNNFIYVSNEYDINILKYKYVEKFSLLSNSNILDLNFNKQLHEHIYLYSCLAEIKNLENINIHYNIFAHKNLIHFFKLYSNLESFNDMLKVRLILFQHSCEIKYKVNIELNKQKQDLIQFFNNNFSNLNKNNIFYLNQLVQQKFDLFIGNTWV
jgi:hypothetical protein